jgi:glutamate synthase domain-containing protein 2
MKYIVVTSLSLLSISCTTCEKASTETHVEKQNKAAITLNTEALVLFDGVSGLIDKVTIRDMVYIGKEITKIQKGGLDKVGKYSYNGKKYTLKQLALLEKKLEEEKNTQNTRLLKELLDQALKDFNTITNPFLAKAQGTKSLMIKLINEWAHKSNRLNSGLLRWGNLSSTEKEALKNNVKTLQSLDILCDDLRDFLLTLIRSCPKAWSSYQDWIKHSK